MKASLLSLVMLNTLATAAAEKFSPCALVNDGGSLTAPNLVVKPNVAVRKLAGQNLAAQVSKGCV